MNFIRIQSANYSATVQLKGAELTQFSAKKGPNLMWNVDDKIWNRCAPNLFPIVGKLNNDCFFWDHETYQMKQHGFARDCLFTVQTQTESQVVLQLTATAETKKQFPFEFSLRITFECTDSGLSIKHDVFNNGSELMPFSIGGHPGFQLNEPLNNYKLVFPASFTEKRWLIENGLYTGAFELMHVEKELPLKDDLFVSDAIVFKNPPFKAVDLVHNTKGKVVRIVCHDWDAIGFWTKKDAPFFCIEPWWGWADRVNQAMDLKEKEGLYWLEAGAHKTVEYIIST